MSCKASRMSENGRRAGHYITYARHAKQLRCLCATLLHNTPARAHRAGHYITCARHAEQLRCLCATLLNRAGHYITYVRHAEQWFCFDDNSVHLSSQKEVERSFGDSQWSFNNDMHAYLVFYQLLPPPAAATEAGSAAASPSPSPRAAAV